MVHPMRGQLGRLLDAFLNAQIYLDTNVLLIIPGVDDLGTFFF